MIEVRVRHEHEIDLRQLRRQRARMTSGGAGRSTSAHASTPIRGNSTGSVEYADAVEIDQHRGVAKPGER